MRRFASIALAAIVSIVCVLRGQTQATPPDAAHPNFSGTWTLNRQLSDDPLESTFDRSQNRGDQEARGMGGYGGRRGFGGRGGGFGGSPRAAASGDAGTQRSATASELIHEAKTSSTSLVISHSDPSLAVTNAFGHTSLFRTDGTSDTHQLPSGTVHSTTRWSGVRLTTQYDLGNGELLTYTYTLVPATQQLVVRIQLQRTQREAYAPVLKLVYEGGNRRTGS
jgi:hypothetical protein